MVDHPTPNQWTVTVDWDSWTALVDGDCRSSAKGAKKTNGSKYSSIRF